MNIGDLIYVKATKVTPSYIKVSYSGKESTLLITELTWKAGKIDPEDYVKEGQTIRVRVTAIKGEKYSVSMREALLGGNPWAKPPKQNETYFSPIVYVTEYGYYFELAYFCRGLMLRENAPENLQIGDRLVVRVMSVDLDRKIIMVIPGDS